jgi:hypothetical protein
MIFSGSHAIRSRAFVVSLRKVPKVRGTLTSSEVTTGAGDEVRFCRESVEVRGEALPANEFEDGLLR